MMTTIGAIGLDSNVCFVTNYNKNNFIYNFNDKNETTSPATPYDNDYTLTL